MYYVVHAGSLRKRKLHHTGSSRKRKLPDQDSSDTEEEMPGLRNQVSSDTEEEASSEKETPIHNTTSNDVQVTT